MDNLSIKISVRGNEHLYLIVETFEDFIPNFLRLQCIYYTGI